MINSVDELIQVILGKHQEGKRHLVAIVGPPGSGKSTLSELVVTGINKQLERDVAVVVPMDGYHLDNTLLIEKGLLHRKGAPETFDAIGLLSDLTEIRQTVTDYSVPIFDRANDCSIANAQEIKKEHSIVVVEGNYLLLNQEPWQKISDIFDLSIKLDVPLETLRERLIQRWLDHGLEERTAIKRAEGNDLPNANTVINYSLDADLVFKSG